MFVSWPPAQAWLGRSRRHRCCCLSVVVEPSREDLLLLRETAGRAAARLPVTAVRGAAAWVVVGRPAARIERPLRRRRGGPMVSKFVHTAGCGGVRAIFGLCQVMPSL